MNILKLGKAVTFIDYSATVLADTEENIQKGLKSIGAEAVKNAALPISRGGNMPVDTGRLMNSVTYATSETHSAGSSPAVEADYAQKGTPEKHEVYIGTNVEYAETQESKHHYLKNAAANHNAEYMKMMKAALK